jgi:hypothetical protein
MSPGTAQFIRSRELPDVGQSVSRGAVAGIVSGLVFLIATMGYVTTKDLPAVAPMIDISTIFHGQDRPVPNPDNVVVGLVTHLTLSVVYGVVFALLVGFLPRRAVIVFAAGVVYGLLLYVVNFQIFGRTLFPWFTNPNGPDQGFEVFIHAVFGLLLAPFLIGRSRAEGVAAARIERVAAPPET